ncbi:MAG TPA: hypothetical protein VIM77_13240 [Mucilaginibacter sp.]
MGSFELQVEQKTYKVIPSASGGVAFNVFNHATFHVIAKTRAGCWEVIEHRFGDSPIPLQLIGRGIDEYLADFLINYQQ